MSSAAPHPGRVVGTVLATLVLLAACGTDPAPTGAAADPRTAGSPAPGARPSASTPPAAPSTDPTTREPSESAPVPEVLQFEATTVAGEPFDGAEVAGRPVVIWFWAPWCAVCRSQVPQVSGLAEQYGDDVAFLGVGSLDGTDAIAGFAADVPALTHLSDPEGALYERFGIAEQSSFVVLDANGDEVLRTGYAEDDALDETVAEIAG